MKRFLLLAATALTLFSCSKGGSNDAAPTTDNGNTITGPKVTINGTDYPIATIGIQTWTTVNYRDNNGTNYGNVSSVDNAQGKLYTWAEASTITLPQGWRLPTLADYKTLALYLGGYSNSANSNQILSDVNTRKIASKDWITLGGTNETGFNAVASGFLHSGTYYDKGESTYFWTSTEYELSNTSAYDMNMSQKGSNGTIVVGSYYNSDKKTDRFSVRFVKDN